MTRTFCDICGKTIIGADPNYNLNLTIKRMERNIHTNLNKHGIFCHDVCDNCAEKIKFYVDSIRKENNNKEN